MRYEYFLFCLVLGTGLTGSSVAAEKGAIIAARSAGNAVSKPTPKPTAAPLLTSTPRPPLDGEKPTPAPTKAPEKPATVILNAPPKLTATPAKEEMVAEKVTEALPLQTPPADGSFTQMESAPKQATALQVTGFITKNGNIYEVTDKNGVGMIESRQSPDSEMSTHVCNYGSVVIYSDVPCNEVTNVRIGEVQHQVVNTAHRDQDEATESQQSSNGVQQAAEVSENNNNAVNTNSNIEDDNEFPDFDDGPPKVQKRKRVNKNPNNQRRRNGNRNRPNAVRQGDAGAAGGKRRRQQSQRLRPQQQRRRQQNNRNKGQQQRRRLQQQQQPQKRRRNQNGNRNGQRRKYQSGESYNRRRYNDDDIYDE